MALPGLNEITESSSNSGLVIGNTSMGNGGLAIINSTLEQEEYILVMLLVVMLQETEVRLITITMVIIMHIFAIAGSERLRITSNGDVRICTKISLLLDQAQLLMKLISASTYVANLVLDGTHANYRYCMTLLNNGVTTTWNNIQSLVLKLVSHVNDSTKAMHQHHQVTQN